MKLAYQLRVGDIVIYDDKLWMVQREGTTWIHDHKFYVLYRKDFWSESYEKVTGEKCRDIDVVIQSHINGMSRTRNVVDFISLKKFAARKFTQ